MLPSNQFAGATDVATYTTEQPSSPASASSPQRYAAAITFITNHTLIDVAYCV